MPGQVTGISVANPGSYSVIPGNSVAVTGGGGTGATFNLTWGPPPADTLAGPESFTSVVNIPDANFTATDIEVTINLTHPHLNQLLIQLVQPGAGGATINLLRNRIDWGGEVYHLHRWRPHEFERILGRHFRITARRAAPVGALPIHACFRCVRR